MRMRNGRLVLGVIVVLIFAVGSYFIFGNRNQGLGKGSQLSSSNMQSNTEVSNSGEWKTYSNSVYKYQFQYPGNWQIGQKEESTGPTLVKPGADANYPLTSEMLGSVSVTKVLFAKSPKANSGDNIVNWKLVDVDGVKGHYYQTDCIATCITIVDLPYNNGQNTFVILSENTDTETFNRILASFKFSDRSKFLQVP